jgi:hypothetical protein
VIHPASDESLLKHRIRRDLGTNNVIKVISSLESILWGQEEKQVAVRKTSFL